MVSVFGAGRQDLRRQLVFPSPARRVEPTRMASEADRAKQSLLSAGGVTSRSPSGDVIRAQAKRYVSRELRGEPTYATYVPRELFFDAQGNLVREIRREIIEKLYNPDANLSSIKKPYDQLIIEYQYGSKVKETSYGVHQRGTKSFVRLVDTKYWAAGEKIGEVQAREPSDKAVFRQRIEAEKDITKKQKLITEYARRYKLTSRQQKLLKYKKALRKYEESKKARAEWLEKIKEATRKETIKYLEGKKGEYAFWETAGFEKRVLTKAEQDSIRKSVGVPLWMKRAEVEAAQRKAIELGIAAFWKAGDYYKRVPTKAEQKRMEQTIGVPLFMKGKPAKGLTHFDAFIAGSYALITKELPGLVKSVGRGVGKADTIEQLGKGITTTGVGLPYYVPPSKFMRAHNVTEDRRQEILGAFKDDKDLATVAMLTIILAVTRVRIGAFAVKWGFRALFGKSAYEFFTSDPSVEKVVEAEMYLLPEVFKFLPKYGKVEVTTKAKLGVLGELRETIARDATREGGYVGGSSAVELQMPRGSVRRGVDVDVYFRGKGASAKILSFANKALVTVKGLYVGRGLNPNRVVLKKAAKHVKVVDKVTGKDIVDVGVRGGKAGQTDKVVSVGDIKVRHYKQVIADKRKIIKFEKADTAKYRKALEDVEKITLAENIQMINVKTIMRGLYLELFEGKAMPLIGISERGIVIGKPITEVSLPSLGDAVFPKHARKNIATYPQSAYSVAILTSPAALKMLKVAPGDVAKIRTIQAMMSVFKNVKRAFNDIFPRETKVLDRKGTGIVIQYLKRFKKEYHRVYGSFADVPQRAPEYRKVPGDIEIEYKSLVDAERGSNKIVSMLRRAGYKAERGGPSGVSVLVNKKIAIDTHFRGEEAAAIELGVGRRYGIVEVRRPTRIEGVRVQAIGEQVVRKFGTAGTWWTDYVKSPGEFGRTIIEPPLHRPKDVVGAYAIGKSIILKRKFLLGYLFKRRAKLDAMLEDWRSAEWKTPGVVELFAELRKGAKVRVEFTEALKAGKKPFVQPKVSPLVVVSKDISSVLSKSRVSSYGVSPSSPFSPSPSVSASISPSVYSLPSVSPSVSVSASVSAYFSPSPSPSASVSPSSPFSPSPSVSASISPSMYTSPSPRPYPSPYVSPPPSPPSIPIIPPPPPVDILLKFFKRSPRKVLVNKFIVYRYSPSLYAIIWGTTIGAKSKQAKSLLRPGRIFTGLEERPIITGRRR